MNTGIHKKGSCWDYWGCPDGKRDECVSFQPGSGDECFIANQFSSKGCRDIEDCYSCSWYKNYREE